MNQPGQTDGYTLARYINEIERYIGKHVLDYAIVNNGEITQEMIKDFNQEGSTQIKIDLENIQNRAISVVKSDLVLTAPGKLIHDSDKIAEIIMSITKSKRIGNLNIVKLRKKHLRKEKTLKLKQLLKNKKSKKNNLNNSSKVSSNKNNISVAEINKVKARANKAVSHATTKKEMKAHAKSTATINKIKEVVNRKG